MSDDIKKFDADGKRYLHKATVLTARTPTSPPIIAPHVIIEGGGTAGTPTSDVTTVQGVTGGTPLNVQGRAYTSSVSISRPDNTTAYIAGDVIGVAGDPISTAGSAILTFANVGAGADSHVLITDASLMVNVATNPGFTSFRLHLYNAIPTAILDNAQWDLPSGDRTSYLGYIDLGSPADFGSTLFVQATAINKKVKLASTSIYGLLVTNTGFTPTSQAVKVVKLETVAI